MTIKKYQIIYADPPWSFRVWNTKGQGSSAENHYPTMAIEDICSLPVSSISDENCVLFLWATCPTLPEAFKVINDWGFKYKTVAFTWVKTNQNTWGYFMGMGYWTRSNAELCLLATKGSPKRIAKNIEQLVVSQRMEHSHKPACIRERIVSLMGDCPRIELFARQKVEGWDIWGNELPNDISFNEALGV